MWTQAASAELNPLSFGLFFLFLDQNFEFLQMVTNLDVKDHLLQNLGATFGKK